MNSALLAWILGVLLVGGSLWLAFRSNLLRDASSSGRPPFSFSRVQLLWWVLIIAFCFLHNYGQHFVLPEINQTCLILMGIGVGTTTVAQVLDGRQRKAADLAGIQLTQDAQSQGFFTDILSDDNGLSVHRLQALVFNVIYGVAFVTQFMLNDGKFEEYGNLQYAVLGLSNVGYLGLKALENDPEKRPGPAPNTAGGDVLLDADTNNTSTAVG